MKIGKGPSQQGVRGGIISKIRRGLVALFYNNGTEQRPSESDE